MATVFDIGNDLLDSSIIGAGIGSIIYNSIQLAIGFLILDFTRRTVKVEFPENEASEIDISLND